MGEEQQKRIIDLIMRYVPTDTRAGENSFRTIEDAKAWESQQYGRASDAGWIKAGKPGDEVGPVISSL